MRCGREAAMAETDVLFTPDLASVVVDLQRRVLRQGMRGVVFALLSARVVGRQQRPDDDL